MIKIAVQRTDDPQNFGKVMKILAIACRDYPQLDSALIVTKRKPEEGNGAIQARVESCRLALNEEFGDKVEVRELEPGAAMNLDKTSKTTAVFTLEGDTIGWVNRPD